MDVPFCESVREWKQLIGSQWATRWYIQAKATLRKQRICELLSMGMKPDKYTRIGLRWKGTDIEKLLQVSDSRFHTLCIYQIITDILILLIKHGGTVTCALQNNPAVFFSRAPFIYWISWMHMLKLPMFHMATKNSPLFAQLPVHYIQLKWYLNKMSLACGFLYDHQGNALFKFTHAPLFDRHLIQMITMYL